MDDKLENLLISLDDEIDRKCIELKTKRQEKINAEWFFFLCSLIVCLPIIFLFAGINILLIALPIACFFAFNLFVLSPLIVNNDMGGTV